MTAPTRWTLADAERYLRSLELFGMRFGLERMRRLMTALDRPERRFRSIHVVGTNGKSSTTRMIAAILQAHGLRAGAYLSPHLVTFAERVRVDDRDLEPGAFARAVERAARAAALVDRRAPADDRVTQFEALTAAAFSELAAREVDVAVVEAGLGGRWDATNVIPSTVQVLTTVGLEHTRWLGPTVRDIAREKLAVVRDGGTLVIGPELPPEAVDEARAAVERHGARLVIAARDPGVEVAAPGAYQRRNFALARAAAEAYFEAVGAGRLRDDAVRAAAASVSVPGRLQVVGHDPLTVLDGAHNPAGMAALAESLPQLADGRPVTAVVSILDDKDAAAMLRLLKGHVARAVFTRSANPRALSPATLASLWTQLGGAQAAPAELEADPRVALERARALAGGDGVVLATGSIYLVADLLAPVGRRQASML